MPNVMKSGSLKLVEPSGPHRACYGTALPFQFWICILLCCGFQSWMYSIQTEYILYVILILYSEHYGVPCTRKSYIRRARCVLKSGCRNSSWPLRDIQCYTFCGSQERTFLRFATAAPICVPIGSVKLWLLSGCYLSHQQMEMCRLRALVCRYVISPPPLT
jgi:hypothetical protein